MKNRTQKDSDNVSIPKELFTRWIQEIDLFEFSANATCTVKKEMKEFLKKDSRTVKTEVESK